MHSLLNVILSNIRKWLTEVPVFIVKIEKCLAKINEAFPILYTRRLKLNVRRLEVYVRLLELNIRLLKGYILLLKLNISLLPFYKRLLEIDAALLPLDNFLKERVICLTEIHKCLPAI